MTLCQLRPRRRRIRTAPRPGMAPARLWLVALACASVCSGVLIEDENPILTYAPRGLKGNLSVWRQGTRVFSGPVPKFEFNEAHFHKEYIMESESGDEVVFVSKGDVCGVGAFTQTEFNRAPISRDTLESRLVGASNVRLPSNRSFGVELEFVVRHISWDAWRDSESLSGTAVADVTSTTDFDQLVHNLHKMAIEHAALGLHEDSADRLLEYLRNTATSKKLVEEIIQQDELLQTLLTTITKVVNLPVVKKSLLAAASNSSNGKSCTTDKDCDIASSCLLAPMKKQTICKPRTVCGSLYKKKGCPPKEDCCPVPLQNWAWTSDISVRPLTARQAKDIGSDASESMGMGLELVSPILSGQIGMRSTLEMVTLLHHLGVQAGPSQGLHVHINVLGEAKEAKGDKLSLEAIGRVWTAWVKYQLVLDEFLSPSRLGTSYSYYSRRLFLGHCGDEAESEASCADNPCPCVRTTFKQMHNAITRMKAGSVHMSTRDFCNTVLSRPGSEEPCTQASPPHQRYFQVNLARLDDFGTIEFRAHSATYDLNRIARWIQFLLIFVERFGNSREGDAAISLSFFDESAEKDLEDLVVAQRTATLQKLWEDLGDLIDEDGKTYYMERQWEKSDPLCSPHASHGLLEYKAEIPGEVEKILQSAADVRLSM